MSALRSKEQTVIEGIGGRKRFDADAERGGVSEGTGAGVACGTDVGPSCGTSERIDDTGQRLVTPKKTRSSSMPPLRTRRPWFSRLLSRARLVPPAVLQKHPAKRESAGWTLEQWVRKLFA